MSLDLTAPPATTPSAPRGTRRRGWASRDVAVLLAGGAAAVFALYLPLPPLEVRSALPTVLLALVALACAGAIARAGYRGAALALGGAALIAAVLGALATTASHHDLTTVFQWSAILTSTLVFATPLIFGALGGIISERSGVFNIGLEGMMLAGAYFAVYGADLTGSWIAGLAFALVAGAAIGGLFAVFAVLLGANQIVAGTAINFLALGLTGYLFIDRYGTEGSPPDLHGVPDVHLPIGSVPFFGGLDRLNLLVWCALALVPAVGFFLFRTKAGLRLRAIGERPEAADVVGVSVNGTRLVAVTAAGALAAVGGAFISIGFVHSFGENLTAGRGYIALAAVILGGWRPGGALTATLLFGLSSTMADRFPAFSQSGATLFQALPYAVTLIAVALFVTRSRPPAAGGVPFRRG